MSTLTLKELSAPTGEVIKIASGKTLDLNSQGTLILPTIPSAKMPAGSVLQVVQGVYSTQTTISTTAYTDSGLSASITPSSTSNKILIAWTTHAALTNGSTRGWGCKLLRNSTAVYTEGTNYRTYGDGNTGDIRLTVPQSHLDSPSTTSAITYKVQVSAHNTAGTQFNQASSETQITLMEIQG